MMNDNILTGKTPFIETIFRLRSNEEIVVFEKQLKTDIAEEKELVFYLENEYENEALEYPFEAPSFDKSAALWAAKIIYFGAQLLLFREETAKDISTLFPEYGSQKSASVHLSADICLRFLPSLLSKLREIDPEDPLIQRMEKILQGFPYSAVGYFTETGKWQPDNNLMENSCSRLLMINRVIAKKDRIIAADPHIKSLIESALGNHLQVFWPNLHL